MKHVIWPSSCTTRNDLSALGLIEVHGRRIHVSDVERLRRHAR